MTDILISPSGQRMLTYVAPIYYRSLVAQAIFQANGQEIDDLQEWCSEIRDQVFFPQRATWSLKYWEFVLGLPTDESKTTATRRQAILSKLVTRVPITPNKINEIAQQSTGKPATTENRISPYTFRVTIDSDGTGVDLVKLNQDMNAAKPAHLTAEYGIKYQGGVQIDAGFTLEHYAGLVFASDSFLCGTYPDIAELYESHEYDAGITAQATATIYTKDYRLTGQFNCGEGGGLL